MVFKAAFEIDSNIHFLPPPSTLQPHVIVVYMLLYTSTSVLGQCYSFYQMPFLLYVGTSLFFKVQLKCHHLCELILDYLLPSPIYLTPLFIPQKHRYY